MLLPRSHYIRFGNFSPACPGSPKEHPLNVPPFFYSQPTSLPSCFLSSSPQFDFSLIVQTGIPRSNLYTSAKFPHHLGFFGILHRVPAFLSHALSPFEAYPLLLLPLVASPPPNSLTVILCPPLFRNTPRFFGHEGFPATPHGFSPPSRPCTFCSSLLPPFSLFFFFCTVPRPFFFFFDWVPIRLTPSTANLNSPPPLTAIRVILTYPEF